MGIVYRARDTRLNRDVALKVLPVDLVSDPDRKRRFVQEAQAAAALNHPNIATVYEIGESNGVSFITMELIDGRKMADVLDGKPLAVRRVLELGSEIAEGLARAHEKGVVHRDMKPANVMLTDDGHAKIIDFGLAKLVEPQTAAPNAPTVADGTTPGVVLGTVSYMSPEQARGDAVDHRTDIFSLGVMLFEMATGRTPFRAKTSIETLNAILTAPAPPVGQTTHGDSSGRHRAAADRASVPRKRSRRPLSNRARSRLGAAATETREREQHARIGSHHDRSASSKVGASCVGRGPPARCGDMVDHASRESATCRSGASCQSRAAHVCSGGGVVPSLGARRQTRRVREPRGYLGHPARRVCGQFDSEPFREPTGSQPGRPMGRKSRLLPKERVAGISSSRLWAGRRGRFSRPTGRVSVVPCGHPTGDDSPA